MIRRIRNRLRSRNAVQLEIRPPPALGRFLDQHPELVDDDIVLDALGRAVQGAGDPVSAHDVVRVLFGEARSARDSVERSRLARVAPHLHKLADERRIVRLRHKAGRGYAWSVLGVPIGDEARRTYKKTKRRRRGKHKR